MPGELPPISAPQRLNWRSRHGAGLTTLGYLLESAALEAGAEAASYDWAADAAQR
jgi:hypothetical protein